MHISINEEIFKISFWNVFLWDGSLKNVFASGQNQARVLETELSPWCALRDIHHLNRASFLVQYERDLCMLTKYAHQKGIVIENLCCRHCHSYSQLVLFWLAPIHAQTKVVADGDEEYADLHCCTFLLYFSKASQSTAQTRGKPTVKQ